jgi:hypothetical protein
MNSLESDLLQVYIDMMKSEYYMVDFFYKRAKEKVEKAPEKEWTIEARETAAKIFTVFVQGIKEEYNQICEGKIATLSNEKLDKLETHFQEILANIDILNEKFPQIVDADFVSKNKEGIKFAREAIEKVLRDFANIYDEFNAFEKESLSWREVQKLYDKAEQKCAIAQSTRWVEAAQNRKLCFQGEVVLLAIELVELINKGDDKIPLNAYPSTAQELNFLQKLTDEFPKILDFFLKTLDEDKKDDYEFGVQKLKAGNEELKSFIQQQRKKLGFSTSRPIKPNPQDQQKIQSQEREIELLKQQLTALQNQIEELKKSQDNKPEVQQQITALQKQKEEIKTSIDQKRNQQEKIQNDLQKQSSQKPFNWLWVVVPGGILLVIAGIIIAYLVGKKNKRE